MGQMLDLSRKRLRTVQHSLEAILGGIGVLIASCMLWAPIIIACFLLFSIFQPLLDAYCLVWADFEVACCNAEMRAPLL